MLLNIASETNTNSILYQSLSVLGFPLNHYKSSVILKADFLDLKINLFTKSYVHLQLNDILVLVPILQTIKY